MNTELNDSTAASTALAPSAELERLTPLVGRWTIDAHTEDSVLGPGGPVRSEEEFSWLDGGHFLVQTYETVFGDEPAQKGVNYWFYDSDAGRFRIIFFSNNGPYSEAGNRYTGRVEGSSLMFEGPARFRYQLDDEGQIATGPDGTISVDWWLRDEGGDWKTWMSNTYVGAAV